MAPSASGAATTSGGGGGGAPSVDGGTSAAAPGGAGSTAPVGCDDDALPPSPRDVPQAAAALLPRVGVSLAAVQRFAKAHAGAMVRVPALPEQQLKPFESLTTEEVVSALLLRDDAQAAGAGGPASYAELLEVRVGASARRRCRLSQNARAHAARPHV